MSDYSQSGAAILCGGFAPAATDVITKMRAKMGQDAVVNPAASTAVANASGGWTNFWQLISAASAGASAYHGYKRNNGSVGWAIGWGLLGGIFPIITPAVALAEGFGKPAGAK